MESKNIFWLVWLIFVGYSFLLAPATAPQSKSTGVYIKQMIFGPFGNIEPSVLSLFYLLGVWPLIYLSILLIDGQNQRFNGTLAALLSNLLGAFVLLPYVALRRSDRSQQHRMNLFIRLFESKITTMFLILSAIGLLGFALLFGDWRIFLEEFHRNHFIHVMTIDFFVLSFLFPFLIPDDLRRRDERSKLTSPSLISFVPLFGSLLHLYQRKPLKQIKPKQ